MTPLALPHIPHALVDELRLDDARPTCVNVREALAAYTRATEDYYAARGTRDIVEADAYEREDGVHWKAATPAGARVLAAWQRARAELAAAVDVRRRELGR